MKINWGLRIVILYTAFVAGMLYLVFRCTREPIDLVTPDYYARELQYDKRYEQLRNSEALNDPLRLAIDGPGARLAVAFPVPVRGDAAGTLYFYKPDRASLDFSLPIALTDSVQVIPTAGMARGAWRLQAEWTSGGKPYFEEHVFVLR